MGGPPDADTVFIKRKSGESKIRIKISFFISAPSFVPMCNRKPPTLLKRKTKESARMLQRNPERTCRTLAVKEPNFAGSISLCNPLPCKQLRQPRPSLLSQKSDRPLLFSIKSPLCRAPLAVAIISNTHLHLSKKPQKSNSEV